MATPAWRCPTCGFAPSTVGPADAAAAVRSYTRRWRALLVRPDDPDPEIVHRRTGPDEPSAVDHAVASAAGMAAAALALERLHMEEDAEVDAGPAPHEVPSPTGAAGDLPLRRVLDQVAAAADELASAMTLFRGDRWAAPGRLSDGQPVDALDLARGGVHAGTHHLRGAERVLAGVRFIRG